MSGAFRIAPMTLADLRLAVDWAAAEGWNPGLEDAETFHAVDPEGFLMGWIDSEPATAISVVRHSDTYGFLGFYLCKPVYRGKGLGLATWQAGMARLDGLLVGLDGVPDQQENYLRSGFAFAHQTQRFSGPVSGCTHSGIEVTEARDIPELVALDEGIGGGINRQSYLTSWFRQTDTRRTVVRRTGGKIDAVATIRTCREGHKIGPIFAPDAAAAKALIETLVAIAGAGLVIVDVPDLNAEAVGLVQSLGLSSVFACARMYTGTQPERDMSQIFGEVSFELG